MEFELSSGRKVEIKRPSVADRIKCGDIATVSVDKDGAMHVENNKRALFEWASAGLGKPLDYLDDFSDNEVSEIGLKVKELAELNPTKGRS